MRLSIIALFVIALSASATRTPPRPQHKMSPPVFQGAPTPVPIPPLDTAIGLEGQLSALSDRVMVMELANSVLEERVKALEAQVEEPSYRKPQNRSVVERVKRELQSTPALVASQGALDCDKTPSVCKMAREQAGPHRWASELVGQKEVDGTIWKAYLRPVVWRETQDCNACSDGACTAIYCPPVTQETWQLDFCILHSGETRVLKDGKLF